MFMLSIVGKSPGKWRGHNGLPKNPLALSSHPTIDRPFLEMY